MRIANIDRKLLPVETPDMGMRDKEIQLRRGICTSLARRRGYRFLALAIFSNYTRLGRKDSETDVC